MAYNIIVVKKKLFYLLYGKVTILVNPLIPGAEKATVVLVALRGRWVIMLLVDEAVAEVLLAT